MKDMGMEKIIFSKDNTLTLPGKSNFIDDKGETWFNKALKHFGKENILVITNFFDVPEGYF